MCHFTYNVPCSFDETSVVLLALGDDSNMGIVITKEIATGTRDNFIVKVRIEVLGEADNVNA